MDGNEFRKVVGFPDYSVSANGTVRCDIRRRLAFGWQEPGKILSPVTDRGYLKVTLFKDGKRNYRKVHRLVADAFIDNEYGKPQVNHKNMVRSDCSAANLEWVTNAENQQHARNTRSKAQA